MAEPTVRLVDLEVIKRFSLAVRQDTAPAADVLAALDASRAVVLAAIGDDVPVKKRASRPRKAAAKKTAAKKTAAKKTAAKKTAAKKTA